jgi:hypothetical protein
VIDLAMAAVALEADPLLHVDTIDLLLRTTVVVAAVAVAVHHFPHHGAVVGLLVLLPALPLLPMKVIITIITIVVVDGLHGVDRHLRTNGIENRHVVGHIVLLEETAIITILLLLVPAAVEVIEGGPLRVMEDITGRRMTFTFEMYHDIPYLMDLMEVSLRFFVFIFNKYLLNELNS